MISTYPYKTLHNPAYNGSLLPVNNEPRDLYTDCQSPAILNSLKQTTTHRTMTASTQRIQSPKTLVEYSSQGVLLL